MRKAGPMKLAIVAAINIALSAPAIAQSVSQPSVPVPTAVPRDMLRDNPNGHNWLQKYAPRSNAPGMMHGNMMRMTHDNMMSMMRSNHDSMSMMRQCMLMMRTHRRKEKH